jgi:hypothetical protein
MFFGKTKEHKKTKTNPSKHQETNKPSNIKDK